MIYCNKIKDRAIGYHSTTEFYVQARKGKKMWRTIVCYSENRGDSNPLEDAIKCFKNWIIHPGERKRLWSPNMNKPTLLFEKI